MKDEFHKAEHTGFVYTIACRQEKRYGLADQTGTSVLPPNNQEVNPLVYNNGHDPSKPEVFRRPNKFSSSASGTECLLVRGDELTVSVANIQNDGDRQQPRVASLKMGHNSPGEEPVPESPASRMNASKADNNGDETQRRKQRSFCRDVIVVVASMFVRLVLLIRRHHRFCVA